MCPMYRITGTMDLSAAHARTCEWWLVQAVRLLAVFASKWCGLPSMRRYVYVNPYASLTESLPVACSPQSSNGLRCVPVRAKTSKTAKKRSTRQSTKTPKGGAR